jgi:molecular chaperone DnaK (HSP70)
MKLCLVFVATLVVVTTAAIVGVDLGSEVIKVGVSVRNEPIHLALNEQSSAKTTHAIVLKGNNEVYIGEGAKKHVSVEQSSN